MVPCCWCCPSSPISPPWTMTVSSLASQTTQTRRTSTTTSTTTTTTPATASRMGRRKQNCPQKTGMTSNADGKRVYAGVPARQMRVEKNVNKDFLIIFIAPTLIVKSEKNTLLSLKPKKLLLFYSSFFPTFSNNENVHLVYDKDINSLQHLTSINWRTLFNFSSKFFALSYFKK
jgi:hypothetical protein